MGIGEHSEAIIAAADTYARAFREHEYGNLPRLKRDALKETIRAAADQHRGAVEALREIHRVLGAGAWDVFPEVRRAVELAAPYGVEGC